MTLSPDPPPAVALVDGFELLPQARARVERGDEQRDRGDTVTEGAHDEFSSVGGF